MKNKIISTVILIFIANVSFAQLDGFFNNAKQKLKNKVNDKINQKVDNGLSKAVDGTDNVITNEVKSKTNSNSETNNGSTNNKLKSGSNKNAMSVNSKFDFVPGEKVVAYEDFSQDAIGDFPDKWNTNGSGEIITTNRADGKWLMTSKETVFYPTWVKNLPDNFTLEFDLISSDNFSFYSDYFIAGFTSTTNVGANFRAFTTYGDGKISNGGGFEVRVHPTSSGAVQGRTEFLNSKNQEKIFSNEIDQNRFTVAGGKNKAHIAIWRQNQRVRVYINDLKVWDIPQGVPDGIKLNSLYFLNAGAWRQKQDDAFYFSNMKLAIGAADTRNKLITEGKFVTNGILFDVNSATIKAESYGAIKDIANVLSENANVNVKIIGHTDSDGDASANLELSKRRAEAVKQSLVSNFKIDASRLSTDGKGATQPIDKNNTAAGKANNRRVEFIKQ